MQKYYITGIKPILGFGLNIKAVDFMPIFDEDEEGQEVIVPFTGLVINLLFLELIFGFILHPT